MRSYRALKKWNNVYDVGEVVPSHIHIIPDWRNAQVGEWVLADDGCVIQVLRRGSMDRRRGRVRNRDYVGTCTGTFTCLPTTKMNTVRRKNIYSFSGKDTVDVITGRKKCTANEQLFCALLSSGEGRIEAYIKAFVTTNRHYANEQSALLIKQERIKTAVRKELEPVLEKLGINNEWALEKLKLTVETSDNETNMLKALFKLVDVLDLEDKTRTRDTAVGIVSFEGFGQNKLGSVERPKLED